MACKKHKLKFTHRGYCFFTMDYEPYMMITWDFVCRYCPYVIRVDRADWRHRLLGKVASDDL